MSGPAPKTGMLVVCRGTPPVGTGPYHKGGELLKPPNLTTPPGYNVWSPPGGGIELEGASKFTYLSEIYCKKETNILDVGS